MINANILLIEDNEGDILLTKEALFDFKIHNEVSVIRDGKDAINFFEALQGFEIMPYIVLLDINVPKVSGIEILKYIKSQDKCKNMPVIMLTTSSSDRDRTEAFKNNANSYLTKPLEVSDLIKAISTTRDFWFEIGYLTGSDSSRLGLGD